MAGHAVPQMITVANLKGGSGKTTSAAFLAHALENNGHRVMAIDSDPQGSLLRWSRRAGWSIPVRHLPSQFLDEELAGLDLAGFDRIIIDTPPGDTDGIVRAAMRAADTLVVAVAPTSMEVRRVRFTMEAAEAVAPETPARVLLNRVVANTLAARDAREALTGAGRSVLRAEIPMRQAIAQAEGELVDSSRGFHGYTAAMLELEGTR